MEEREKQLDKIDKQHQDCKDRKGVYMKAEQLLGELVDLIKTSDEPEFSRMRDYLKDDDSRSFEDLR